MKKEERKAIYEGLVDTLSEFKSVSLITNTQYTKIKVMIDPIEIIRDSIYPWDVIDICAKINLLFEYGDFIDKSPDNWYEVLDEKLDLPLEWKEELIAICADLSFVNKDIAEDYFDTHWKDWLFD